MHAKVSVTGSKVKSRSLVLQEFVLTVQSTEKLILQFGVNSTLSLVSPTII